MSGWIIAMSVCVMLLVLSFLVLYGLFSPSFALRQNGSASKRNLFGPRAVVPMRTLTEKELQEQIDVCLWRLGVYVETGKWTYDPFAKSLDEAEKALSQARKTAARKIRRLGKMDPSRAASTNRQWIDYVLMAESWRFVLWLQERGIDLQQQREEMELLLIEHVGMEIKRLGFQLEL